jgi:hypothetical protein
VTRAVRNRAALITLATLALVASACDSKVGGTPQAADTPTNQASTPAPSSGNSDNPFADMNACTVVDQVMAGQGFPPAQPSAADRFRSCASNKPGDANVGVALQDNAGYDQSIPDPSKTSRGHVGPRNAIIERDPIGAAGQCVITIEVKPNSRVLVSLSGNSPTEQACERVTAIAVKVEKLLPPNT